jgi:RNA polymerase sigma factor (sigma-70 family)
LARVFRHILALIYNFARKSGLNDAEAQDEVQNTFIYLTRRMPKFHYDRTRGSFKSWLRVVTRSRIHVYCRKEKVHGNLIREPFSDEISVDPEGPEAMPDLAAESLDEEWQREWEQNLVNTAFRRLPTKVSSQHLLIFRLMGALLLSAFPANTEAQGTAFTYQGQLLESNVPATGLYDLQFTIYNARTGGIEVGPVLTSAATAVSNGLFTVTLDFGSSVFTGPNLWLAIAARANGGVGFTALTPRQPLTAAPYAIFAGGAVASGLSGSLSLAQLPSEVVTNNASNVNLSGNLYGTFRGNGNGLTDLNASQLGNGIVPANVLPGFQAPNYNTISGGLSNSVGGFGAFIGGGGFDGTNHQENSAQASGSTIGGGLGNSIPSTGLYGFIGGGDLNTASGFAPTVGGGKFNTASSYFATVAGGFENTASAGNGTVAGGVNNTASGYDATVSGGEENTASGTNATVGGGYGNRVSGNYSTVPGGVNNTVSGAYSFAAGFNAQCPNFGSFVWSDTTAPGVFSSTANNQFAVRAGGGVLLEANVNIGTGGSDYHQVALGGGNSTGFLFGSFSALGDGIHLGYNQYFDEFGNSHIINSGGGTSRISVGYGSILFYTGTAGTIPNYLALEIENTTTTVKGTFNNNCDRNAKQDFSPVSASQILDGVTRLPIEEWSYKADPSTRHIGPVAQDFYSVFNIGTDNKHIAPIDEGGVALAAIQGLDQKVNEKDQRLRKQEAQIEKQTKEIEDLKQQIKQLSQLVSTLKQKFGETQQ